MCRTPAPWEPRSSNETYQYKGQEFSLSDIEYSVCRECGFDLVLPQQTRRNEARVRDEHRRIDGLLTGGQIKAIRKRLGLTQAQAARLMGGGDNAFSKYERGEVTQSAAMNSVLLLLDAFPDGLKVLAGLKSQISGQSKHLPVRTDTVSIVRRLESPVSVQSEHVLRATVVEVPEAGITEHPIRLHYARRVSVERARRYPAERLAA